MMTRFCTIEVPPAGYRISSMGLYVSVFPKDFDLNSIPKGATLRINVDVPEVPSSVSLTPEEEKYLSDMASVARVVERFLKWVEKL